LNYEAILSRRRNQPSCQSSGTPAVQLFLAESDSPMPTPLEQLTSQAIALSPEDRARLADLLPPADEADEPMGEEWDQEIWRRLKTVKSGTARLIASADVHAEARKIYQR